MNPETLARIVRLTDGDIGALTVFRDLYLEGHDLEQVVFPTLEKYQIGAGGIWALYNRCDHDNARFIDLMLRPPTNLAELASH